MRASHPAWGRASRSWGRARDGGAQRPLHQAVRVLLGEDATAVERIHEERAGLVVHADQEVARRPDAVDLEAQALGHRLVDEGQRDGDAAPGRQHARQEAVGGVVVVEAVAGEALLFEEHLVEVRHACTPAVGAEAAADRQRKAVDPLQHRPRLHVVHAMHGDGARTLDEPFRRREAAQVLLQMRVRAAVAVAGQGCGHVPILPPGQLGGLALL